MNAVLYFASYAQLGLMVTWWPLVILSMGGHVADVGWIFSGRIAASMAAQAIWPSLADRRGNPVVWLRRLQVLGLLPLLALPWTDGLWTLAAILWTSTFFHGAISPIQDAWVMESVGPDGFGARRLWGSVGYGVVVAGFGFVLAGQSQEQLAQWAVLAAIAVATLGVAAAFGLPEDRTSQQGGRRASMEQAPPHASAAGWDWVLFMGMHACHWGAISVFNVYLTTYTTTFGWSSSWPAAAIAVAITAEVVGLALARRAGVSARMAAWLTVIFGISALRWLAMAAWPDPLMMVILQSVHLLGFGFWLVLALHGVRTRFAHGGPAAAQGWFAVVVLGCGGMAATGAAAALSAHYSVEAVFYLAFALELLALVLLWAERVRRGA